MGRRRGDGSLRMNSAKMWKISLLLVCAGLAYGDIFADFEGLGDGDSGASATENVGSVEEENANSVFSTGKKVTGSCQSKRGACLDPRGRTMIGKVVGIARRSEKCKDVCLKHVLGPNGDQSITGSCQAARKGRGKYECVFMDGEAKKGNGKRMECWNLADCGDKPDLHEGDMVGGPLLDAALAAGELFEYPSTDGKCLKNNEKRMMFATESKGYEWDDCANACEFDARDACEYNAATKECFYGDIVKKGKQDAGAKGWTCWARRQKKAGKSTSVFSAIKYKQFMWPKKSGYVRIPYQFDRGFNELGQMRVLHAIAQFKKNTCVHWVPKTPADREFVYIYHGQGCFSAIGKQGIRAGGRQLLSLSDPGCLRDSGTAIHEMMHAMGWFHEQSRGDRDKHVNVVWSNIPRSKQSQFKKYQAHEATYGLPYDIHSVMHYENNAFGFRRNGVKATTMTAKADSNMKLGNRKAMTIHDINDINTHYGCDKAQWPIRKAGSKPAPQPATKPAAKPAPKPAQPKPAPKPACKCPTLSCNAGEKTRNTGKISTDRFGCRCYVYECVKPECKCSTPRCRRGERLVKTGKWNQDAHGCRCDEQTCISEKRECPKPRCRSGEKLERSGKWNDDQYGRRCYEHKCVASRTAQASCSDKQVFCRTLKNYCRTNSWVKDNCKKTCRLPPCRATTKVTKPTKPKTNAKCADRKGDERNCPSWAKLGYCTNRRFKSQLKRRCFKSCGYC